MDNLYQPPAADLSLPAALSDEPPFFISAPHKVVALFLLTFGFYSVYWFYRHWRAQEQETPEIWPAMRSVFNLFFTHALFRRIADKHAAAGLGRWDYSGMAWFYVAMCVFSNVVDRIFSDNSFASLASIFIVMSAVIPLQAAQAYANRASGDPEGQSNSGFTLANWLWATLGIFLWIFVLIGALMG